jgi:hypothetical protein
MGRSLTDEGQGGKTLECRLSHGTELGNCKWLFSWLTPRGSAIWVGIKGVKGRVEIVGRIQIVSMPPRQGVRNFIL